MARFFALLFTYGYEEHDDYVPLETFTVCLQAASAEEAYAEVRDEWLYGDNDYLSRWCRLEEVVEVELPVDRLVQSWFTDEAGNPFTLPIEPVQPGVWVF